MSSPTAAPNATASLVAASAVADRKLLASFTACAMPGFVAHPITTVAQPGQHRLDSRSRLRRVPAYITVRVRARAPATPPETGASMYATPALAHQPGNRACCGDADRRGVDDVRHRSLGGREDLGGYLFRYRAVGQAEHDDVACRATSATDVAPRRAVGIAVGSGGVVGHDVEAGRRRGSAASAPPMLPKPTNPTRSSRLRFFRLRPEPPADCAGPRCPPAHRNRQRSGRAVRRLPRRSHPSVAVLAACSRNSSIRPSAAVIAITSRLRSRGLSAPLAGPHAPGHRGDVVLKLGHDRVRVICCAG